MENTDQSQITSNLRAELNTLRQENAILYDRLAEAHLRIDELLARIGRVPTITGTRGL